MTNIYSSIDWEAAEAKLVVDWNINVQTIELMKMLIEGDPYLEFNTKEAKTAYVVQFIVTKYLEEDFKDWAKSAHLINGSDRGWTDFIH